MYTNLSGQRLVPVAPTAVTCFAHHYPADDDVETELQQWLPGWLEYLTSLELDDKDRSLYQKYRILEIQLRKWRGGHVAYINSQEASRIYSLGYDLIEKHKEKQPGATALSWIRYNLEGLKETIAAPCPGPKQKDFEVELWCESSMKWMGAILYFVRSELDRSKVDEYVEIKDLDEDVEMKDVDKG